LFSAFLQFLLFTGIVIFLIRPKAASQFTGGVFKEDTGEETQKV
jgi:hypothetical protein